MPSQGLIRPISLQNDMGGCPKVGFGVLEKSPELFCIFSEIDFWIYVKKLEKTQINPEESQILWQEK